MKIWIDISNAPHVNFMEPIVNELKKKGIETVVTARDYAQTIQLLRMKKIEFIRIDSDYSLPMVIYTLQRAYRLYKFLKDSNIDVGFSHGSRSMAIAGRLLRKKIVITFDYEYVEHRIFNLFATKLLLPDVLSGNSLGKLGYNIEKMGFYPGYKEEVYLSDYITNQLFPEELKIDSSKIVITARPPASKSHYFSDKINILFWKAIKYVSKEPSVVVYITPRYRDSIETVEKISRGISKNIIVLRRVVNGIALLESSDLFIGAGGTMSREAALLNTPSYSLFYKKGAVDKSLEEKGLLCFIQRKEDINQIRVAKKEKISRPKFPNFVDFFIDQLISTSYARNDCSN